MTTKKKNITYYYCAVVLTLQCDVNNLSAQCAVMVFLLGLIAHSAIAMIRAFVALWLVYSPLELAWYPLFLGNETS